MQACKNARACPNLQPHVMVDSQITSGCRFFCEMVQWTHLLVGNASVGQSIAESSKTSTDRSGKFGLARLLCHAGNRLNHSMLCWRQLIGAHFRAGTSSELMESPGHVKGVPASQGCYPCPAERSPFFPSSKYVLVISRAKECVKQNEWSISGCLWVLLLDKGDRNVIHYSG